MELEFYVNTQTGELQTLWSWDEKYETKDFLKINNNRDGWRKLSENEYKFLVLVGECYMKEQNFLNQSDV